MSSYDYSPADFAADCAADFAGDTITSTLLAEDGSVIPAPSLSTPGTRLLVKALLIDERHIGHLIAGVDDQRKAYSGQLRGVTRHLVEDRIIIIVGDIEHRLGYTATATVTIVRSMPTDPRPRTGRRTELTVELSDPASDQLAA